MISKEETRRLLIEVRDDLASGRITAEQFDMGDVLETYDCGTVGCIAGWAMVKNDPKVITGELPSINLTFDVYGDEGLSRLFYNYYADETPTPAQAVQAIDAYLAGSDDPWFWIIP